MRAKVMTSAMGPQYRDQVYEVVGKTRVGRIVLYDLDVTPITRWTERKIYPFSAGEVKLIKEAS